MTVLEYLNGYRLATIKVDKLTRELKELEETREAVNPSTDGTPRGSGASDRTGRIAAEIADLEETLRYCIAEALEIKRGAVRLINQLTDADEYRVVYGQYVECKSQSELAEEMHMSRSTIRDIRENAIASLEKKNRFDQD